MQFSQDDLKTGIDLGQKRVSSIFPEVSFSPELTAATRGLVSYALEKYKGERLSGRFVVLFSELVTIASAARAAYPDEAPLTNEYVLEYLYPTAKFFNSVKHGFV